MLLMGIISNIKNWLHDKRRRVRNWLWGYDYFISYHWRSGGRYAVALSQLLQERQFDCFLDKTEFVAGDDWLEEAASALQNTQRLIVIATREAVIDSVPVAHEVEVFAHRSRHIIPIRFGDEYTDEERRESSVMAKITESVIQLTDSRDALLTGRPDRAEVVEKLIATDKVLRRRKLRLAVVSIVLSVLLVAFVVTAILGLVANNARLAEAASALNAEERAKEAQVEAEKAIASQNFAEYLRVSQRATTPDLKADERRALETIAPKYLEQSHARLRRATQLKNDLDEWRTAQGRLGTTSNRTFSLEVIPTRLSGALLLSYGTPAHPEFILIDGGDKLSYRDKVKPALRQLAEHSDQDGRLKLELVISSQIDIWQIGGLSEMLRELDSLRDSGDEAPWLSIKNLWANAFFPFAAPEPPAYTDDGKIDLLIAAHALGIPINKPFSKWVAGPEAGAARIRWSNDLIVTVLAPKVDAMNRFARFWVDRYLKLAKRGQLPFRVTFEERDLVETFADARIELLPAPIVLADTSGTSGADASVTNLSSIVLILESHGKRILLTSDTTDKILLQSLAQAGIMDADGICQVDVLVLPHDGSDRNVSPKFFASVVAEHYVALGDGKHNNPEANTFKWLLESRRGTNRKFEIYLTRHPREYLNESRGYPADDLLQLFRQERAKGTPFRVYYPRKAGDSFGINLLQPPDGFQDTLVELEF